MRVFHYVLVGSSVALALAGCGKQGSGAATAAGATSDDAQLKPARPVKLQPGKWTTTMEMNDIKMVGAPPGMPPMPKPKPKTETSCLTPEEASRGPAELLKDGQTGCTTTRNVDQDGKMDMAMTCKTPKGGTMSTKWTGSYSPTEMTFDADIQSSGDGGISIAAKVHGTAKRIGECTG